MTPIKLTELDPNIQRFSPTTQVGLTQQEVTLREQENLTNAVKNKFSKSYRSIFFSNIVTFFNLLCMAVAVAVLAVGSYKDAIFMVIIVLNIAIGITQEIKAKLTIEKLSLVSSPTADVVRNSQSIEIPVDQLVLDDITNLSSGKQICADSIILEGKVTVNESLLTGESQAVKKEVGDILYAGSFIISGQCTARVERVGTASYVQQLSMQAKKYKKPSSQLLVAMRRIIKVLSAIIIPLSILVAVNNYINTDHNLQLAVVKTAGSIIGMIPAGMFLLTSVALAVSVIKLAKQRTLVQDLYCIEMLARANVLCLDKTGTLTDGNMVVKHYMPLLPPEKINFTHADILSSMLFATKDKNLTAQALKQEYGSVKILKPTLILPFSSERKYSAVTFEQYGTYALGASDFIPHKSDSVLSEKIKVYAEQGYRVLLLARSPAPIKNETCPKDMIPVGIVVLEDHIREDAVSTIQHFKDNDVVIKVISGDNPITVSNIAMRVGIEHAESYINLEGLTETEVENAALQFTVFGRVTPDQKAILIRALKNAGKTVAMTGDGVNDILAMKEADCSIAMASGSEAARNVAHLVLLDSNFSSMPQVVYEGRRVINNIQKSSSLFLMKTIFTIILSIVCIIIGRESLFSPQQYILMEFFVIGVPSFFLTLEPNRKIVTGKFISTIIKNALPAALVLALNVLLCTSLFTNIPEINASEIQTVSTLSVTYTAFIILCILCWKWNNYRFALLALMLTSVTAVIYFLPGFFELVPLTLGSYLALGILFLLTIPTYLLLKWLFKLVETKILKIE